jgi:hypothetical protein
MAYACESNHYQPSKASASFIFNGSAYCCSFKLWPFTKSENDSVGKSPNM